MADESKLKWVIWACVLLVVSTASVVGRILGTRVRGKKTTIPDYLVIFALLCETGCVVDVSILGTCLHIPKFSPRNGQTGTLIHR